MIRKMPDRPKSTRAAAAGSDTEPPPRRRRAARQRSADEREDGPADEPRSGDQDADEPTDGPRVPDTGAAKGGAEPSEAGDEPGDGADGAPEAGRPDSAPRTAGDLRPLPLRVEALLFASPRALAAAKIARLLKAPLEAVKQALDGLQQRWTERDSALELVEISNGYRFMTRAEFQDDLAGLAKKGKVENLSPAALETLAIVAYRQPIARADIETVRGVQSGPLLRVLLDRDLIRIAGRSPDPGHPLLYGTTKRFLDHFGLKSLKQLPDIKDLLDSP